MADVFYEPKSDINALLSTLSGVEVSQERPEKEEQLPWITFSISNNNAKLNLDRGIGYQEVEVTLDILAKESVESGELLKALEGLLRENDMHLTFSRDVPDPDGYSHIATRFNFLY